MLPFVFDAFHELFEARFAADVGQPGGVLIEKRIIYKATIIRIFKPIQFALKSKFQEKTQLGLSILIGRGTRLA